MEVDLAGKKPGRGAYLCHEPKCWEVALTQGRLDHALKVHVNDGDRAEILRQAESFGDAREKLVGRDRNSPLVLKGRKPRNAKTT